MPDETKARPVVLVTGAAGYLGRRIVEQCQADGSWDVVAHTRATGDLCDPQPFARLPADVRARIRHIVHSAAVTRFNVDAATADAVNVEGTRRVVDVARACPNLERLALISTVYASGLRSGAVPEERLDDSAGFANHYERSKWEAEEVVAASGVPWTIARVATVIADADDGAVGQHNAFHTTLRLWFYGLLSVLPGKPATPLYLVTGDFVAGHVRAILGADPGVYHLSHTRAESLTLGDALAIAAGVFEEDAEFRRKRILPPLLADAESFGLMAEGIATFGGEVVSQAMGTVSPFGAQLYIDKDIENGHLRAAVDRYEAPDAPALLANVVRFLVATRWGRRDAVA